MIIGGAQSADGGFRRIPIRHTHIVDDATRKVLVNYLKERIFQKCKTSKWVGYRDIFPQIPKDILDTPLKVIYDICCTKFADAPNTINRNVAKYLGILTREAVYYSEAHYFEQMLGSIRVYSLESKNLKENDFKKNRKFFINGGKK